MYSALKVNGKKLYELAREGIEIERKARTVHFYEISILEVKLPLVRMEVTCSKGTYIRTLCHDIGEKLGCHGCMEQLIRTRVGQFDRNGAHTLDEIAAIVGEGRLSEILVPVDEMFAALRSFATADDHAKKLAENGNPRRRSAKSGKLLPAGTSQKTRSSAFISMTERLSVFINTDHHKT